MLFMDDLGSRLANRVQLTSDGHKAYHGLRPVRIKPERCRDSAARAKTGTSPTGFAGLHAGR
jgi:hypothetical protein